MDNSVVTSNTKENLNKDIFRYAIPVDFEVAIEESGFGLFNILLLLATVFCIMATYFESSTMSYIFSSAECDLNLTLTDKGLLNAVTYGGMITSAILWGCVADAKGRKKALVIGFLLDVVCVVAGAASQKAYQLMIFKFLGGFIMSGPYPVMMSYLGELHGKTYRPQIMMVTGTMYSLSSVILPLMAVGILPLKLDLEFLGLKIHSWQLFVISTATTSLVGGLLLMFFPESPKFLMSKGRNQEALKVFQQIYAMNKRKPREFYPVKHLIDETVSRKASLETGVGNSVLPQTGHLKSLAEKGLLRRTWEQSRPLFMKPYLSFSLQIFWMSFLILLGQNTMRLWIPQLFASIEEYTTVNGDVGDMCKILEYGVNKTRAIQDTGSDSCEVLITVDTYFNNIIVGLLNLVGYLLVSVAVKYIDVKQISNFGLLIAASCGIGLYFSSAVIPTVISSALYSTAGSISTTALASISVNIFPTRMRTLVISLTMMFGRLGSIFGNILFPELMIIGCIPPFLMISSVMLGACLLGFLLPSTNKLSLK